ncbi:MAG: hypothetical protein HFG12_04060 [Oscillibacter sp.]|nr:hypothetical protein [uncultured Oscillibacter sp.]MCI8812403.1 hypothetical protein [Oscillibacter sp.]
MKVFFASFFICLVLICGVMLLGALFGGFGLLLLAVLALAAPISVLVNILKTQRKKQEELEKRIHFLENREHLRDKEK